MNKLKVGAILALFLSAVPFSSCDGSDKNANAGSRADASNNLGKNANAAKTNVEELGLLVNVPFETEDIVWKEDASQKKIIAVLRFAPADSIKLVAEAEKIRQPEPTSLATQTWFPAELIAQSEMSGGDDNLNGRSYAANQFFQEPFTAGRIIRIENTDYFVLELTSK